MSNNKPPEYVPPPSLEVVTKSDDRKKETK